VNDALRFFVRPTLRDAPLLLAFGGWNDAGEAATMALRIVASHAGAAPLAEIDCEEFFDFTVERPQVGFDEEGAHRIEWPHTVFRFGSMDPAREIVLGWGPEPHLRWRHYCDCVLRFVHGLAVRRVVLLGAYLADVVYSRPVAVSGFSSDPAVLGTAGVTASHYEGPTGIAGVLGDRLSAEGIEFSTLWAGLPHYIGVSPNPRGALALLERLTTLIGLRLDLEPLRSEAARFEGKVSALVAEDPELGEYVRQLKRRDFAQ
jgi:predicted ATP-grasp superfamily ATP-dependent carboligase